MADRVSASIRIGGKLSLVDFAHLTQLIKDEGLSEEWDGPPFDPAKRKGGEPLFLCAYQVPWGCFAEIEDWCRTKGLPFARWSGACLGQWGAQRAVFTGTGPLEQYAACEDDYILMGEDTAKRLGSLDAILAYFAAASVAIPALVVADNPDAVAPLNETRPVSRFN